MAGRTIHALFLAVVVGTCAFAAVRWRRLEQVASAFPSVVLGQSAESVHQRLGTPDITVDGGPSHWCSDHAVASKYAVESDRACKRQWLYQQWPIPACFSVCFGPDHRVVSTYHYVSP